MNNFKRQKYYYQKQNLWMMILAGIFTGILVLSWNSKAFTNWYRLHVFPVLTGTLGRLSNFCSGSVGEVLIFAGICYVLLGMVLLFATMIRILVYFRSRKSSGHAHKAKEKQGFLRARRIYLRCLSWIVLIIYGLETLNCFVLYHAPTVEEQFFDTKADYGTRELIDAYTRVVTQANALSGQMQRDADGQAVYQGTREQLYTQCRKAMQAQGETYPYLAGYYPNPKPIRASGFMSQQHLQGIYFPFTMEANYNTLMYPVNVPVTICHEFSHLKGVILEDEANFFGFVACIESPDPYLQYSGYLSVLGYLARQVRASVPEQVREQMVQATEQVQRDDVFLTQAQWKQVEEKAALPTEIVNKATDAFLEKNLTMNGVQDGIQSYSRVVRLVLAYYGEQS